MRLSSEQVQQYHDDGFLIVEDVFTDDELRPVLDWFEAVVDEWADKLHNGGKIKNKYEGEDVYTRLWSVEKEWPGAAALVTQRNSMGPALATLWNSDKLLDMVAQFIGADIDGHPVSIFRSKTPDTALMTVPWHQDSAYFVEGGEGTLQPTAWIPFIDTTVENGTLQLICGSQKPGKVYPHRLEKEVGHRESWYLYIPEEELPPGDRAICEVKMGSVLWHQNMVVHRSTENHSDKVRWTCDLRYRLCVGGGHRRRSGACRCAGQAPIQLHHARRTGGRVLEHRLAGHERRVPRPRRRLSDDRGGRRRRQPKAAR